MLKTFHLLVISILMLGLVSLNVVFAQLQSQSGMIQLSIPKFNFVDGEMISISGRFLPYSTIHISLSDNLGNLENSTEVNANNTGNFQTNLGIPSHVIGGGSWHILAVSDETFKTLQIMVNTHGIVTMPSNFPSGLSPLKQFKLGLMAGMVQCHSDFQLMLKKENGEFACVKKDTANKLFDRGWGIFPLHGLPTPQKSQNATLPESFMPCNTPYPSTSSGVSVIYMPLNSTGRICVQYSNSNPPTTVGLTIFEANHIFEKPRYITFWPDNQTIPTGNSTVVYYIKTENHAGFYGVDLYCVPIPLAVGYDNDSRIVSSDFPWLGKTYMCPIQTYAFQITGTTGIGVKFIPYP